MKLTRDARRTMICQNYTPPSIAEEPKPDPLTAEQQALAAEWGRLPKYVLKRWFGQCTTDTKDELLLVGNLALCEAAQRFDPERDVKFFTFGVRWIWGRMMSSRKKARRGQAMQFVPIGAEGDDPFDTIESPCQPKPVDHFQQATVDEALGRLQPLHQQVLRLRFGFDGHLERNIVEVAAVLGRGAAWTGKLLEEALTAFYKLVRNAPKAKPTQESTMSKKTEATETTACEKTEKAEPAVAA